jgi:hypothetical protein
VDDLARVGDHAFATIAPWSQRSPRRHPPERLVRVDLRDGRVESIGSRGLPPSLYGEILVGRLWLRPLQTGPAGQHFRDAVSALDTVRGAEVWRAQSPADAVWDLRSTAVAGRLYLSAGATEGSVAVFSRRGYAGTTVGTRKPDEQDFSRFAVAGNVVAVGDGPVLAVYRVRRT